MSEFVLRPLLEFAGEKENGWISGRAKEGGDADVVEIYDRLASFCEELVGEAGNGTALDLTRDEDAADVDAEVEDCGNVGDIGEFASMADPIWERAAESID